jgi:hypothetical protein
MPWYQSWNGKFVDKTSSAEWTKCMNDSRVITLEDLSQGWGTFVDTAIRSLQSEEPADNNIFDLQGRRLAKVPSKGVYIINGKKYIKN